MDMKKLFFTIAFISSCQFGISQIKSQLKEILFGLSIPSSKYDTRKVLHSTDNYSKIIEYSFEKYDIISADFKDNYKLSFLGTSSERTASFWFNKGTDINFAFGFTLRYLPHYVDDCTKQYNEVMSFFKTISYKASNEPWVDNGVKRGEWY